MTNRTADETALSIARRKDEHLELCATDEVAFNGKTTLLECVHLVHNSLPELAWEELDTSVTFCSKPLRFPILIAGMTGGSTLAEQVNHDLASFAESRGYAFGVGSQRAMDRDQKLARTYRVRDHAPTTLVFGNIGAVQARTMSSAQVEALVRSIGADALCVHLNPAQELIQTGGDRDFRGCLDAIERLQRELQVEVIVKETGSGMSESVCRRLHAVGIRTVDVSGAGGTSWVGVETLRGEGIEQATGQQFWNWGIPTAVATQWAVEAGLNVVATGGIRHGLDVAKALALGASLVGIARQFFMAQQRGGLEALHALGDALEHALQAAMLLTGSRNIAELQQAPRVIDGELRDWLATRSI